MFLFCFLAALACFATRATANVSIDTRTGTLPYFLVLRNGNRTVVINDGVYIGDQNTTLSLASTDGYGQISNNGTSGSISAQMLGSVVARIEVNTTSTFTGARFALSTDEKIYGIWEYPWHGSLQNKNLTFALKGVGNAEGINWNNARAPFFLSSYGYGVYADTLQMGTYDFSDPNHVSLNFKTSNLVYYIILPEGAGNDYKSILSQYTALSARIEMPPDSAYGPTFWSDDFEQDFHGSVSDAQDNILDVVDHLYYNRIHATSIIADRPYGTGNQSFGNMDFDPEFYPDPEELISNLTDWGYDFQVWVANRAFKDTKLHEVGKLKQWLFPSIDPEKFSGPALDLRIQGAYSWMKQALGYFANIGVKGFKIDRGEEGEMPVEQQNIQMDLFEKLTHDLMQEKWGKGNFYNFARSCVDRSRKNTGIWNGDAHADWKGLKYSIASGIRAGLLGFSMWGSDTGGYNRKSPPYDLNEELWARWMWFSTFSPVFEIMVGTGHTPWYSPYTNDLMHVLKRTTDLHHALSPFIKSYTYRATQDGIPLIRALILQVPNDLKVYDLADEYFFGNEFLVAPIVNAGGRRAVYFPLGLKYLDYFDKSTVYTGGGSVEVLHGVDTAPVYVRSGAIVPKGDIYRGNNKWTEDWKPSLEVELYPSFDVSLSTFRYFNGKAEVNITMTAYHSGEVNIAWGDLGVDGLFKLYYKGGFSTVRIVAGQNGTANFQSVRSAFET